MFIWIMLALALIWVGLAVWGHLDNQKPKQKKVEIKKTEKVDESKERLEKAKQEANIHLREQGYKSTVHVSSGTSRTFTATSAPNKKYSDTSVSARKQTSTSTPSRNTSRNRNDDDYNNNFLGSTAFLQTSNDSDSGRCYGGGHTQSHHDTGGSGGGYSGGHDSGSSDGGSVSCD